MRASRRAGAVTHYQATVKCLLEFSSAIVSHTLLFCRITTFCTASNGKRVAEHTALRP
jgi:hypothetical protein